MRIVASLVLILSLLGSPQCQGQSAARSSGTSGLCSVAGQVTSMSTGQSIKTATIWLRPVNTDTAELATVRMSVLGYGSSANQGLYSVTARDDGSFCFENVTPGLYTMTGSKTGYLETSYRAVSPTESGKIIVVQAEPLRNLKLALISQAVVGGRITDEDSEPVSGATVSLLMRMVVGGQVRNVPVRGAQSNDLGEFRVASVAPGTYYVVVDPKPAIPHPAGQTRSRLRTFYPGVSSFTQATPIVVRAGEGRLGLNVELLSGQTHYVRGSISGLLPTDQGSIQIHPEEEQQVFIAIGGPNYRADGSFEFAGIATGTYTLSYFQLSGDSAKSARVSITVGDRDVNDVVLSVVNSVAVAGHINVEGSTGGAVVDFSKLRVNLSSADAIVGPSVNAVIDADGAFVVRNIIPGRYTLRVEPPKGTYLKVAHYGRVDVKDGELEIVKGGSDVLELVYEYGLATVIGRVESHGRDTEASRLVLIPLDRNSTGNGLILGTSDGTGAFLISSVPPGRYRAHAFESIDFAALESSDVRQALRSSGTPIEIAEGERKSITLPLTSSEEHLRLVSIASGQ